MKNSVILYGVIALGVIVLAVGMYYYIGVHPFHKVRAFTGLGVGAALLIAGIVGIVMASRPKLVNK